MMIRKEDNRPRVIALGTFDGVHRGHQELIRQGKRMAEEMGAVLRVCTFDCHPLEILRPELAPKRLTDADEQMERMRAAGADEIQVIPFTRETAMTEPEDFLRMLRENCRVAGLVCGWNYSFGRKGRGNAEMLEEDGRRNGYRTLIVPPVTMADGTVISSTEIRERLSAGDLAAANEMLGAPYTVRGTVIHGIHRGTGTGLHAAHIAVPERKQLPACGVYAGHLTCERRTWKVLMNIGVQPAMPSGKVKLEAWALEMDPETELYGKTGEVELRWRLREELPFRDRDALIRQIARDRAEAERLL